MHQKTSPLIVYDVFVRMIINETNVPADLRGCCCA